MAGKRKLRWSKGAVGDSEVYVGRDPVKWTRAVLVKASDDDCWEWFRWNGSGGVRSGFKEALKEAEKEI